jgi:hypothetical protein
VVALLLTLVNGNKTHFHSPELNLESEAVEKIKSKLHDRSFKYWTGFIWVPKLRNRLFASQMYLSGLIHIQKRHVVLEADMVVHVDMI